MYINNSTQCLPCRRHVKNFKINLLPVSTSVLQFRINLASFLLLRLANRALMKTSQTSGGVWNYHNSITISQLLWKHPSGVLLASGLFCHDFLKESKPFLHLSNCPFFCQQISKNFFILFALCQPSLKKKLLSYTHMHTYYIKKYLYM